MKNVAAPDQIYEFLKVINDFKSVERLSVIKKVEEEKVTPNILGI